MGTPPVMLELELRRSVACVLVVDDDPSILALVTDVLLDEAMRLSLPGMGSNRSDI